MFGSTLARKTWKTETKSFCSNTEIIIIGVDTPRLAQLFFGAALYKNLTMTINPSVSSAPTTNQSVSSAPWECSPNRCKNLSLTQHNAVF